MMYNVGKKYHGSCACTTRLGYETDSGKYKVDGRGDGLSSENDT